MTPPPLEVGRYYATLDNTVYRVCITASVGLISPAPRPEDPEDLRRGIRQVPCFLCIDITGKKRYVLEDGRLILASQGSMWEGYVDETDALSLLVKEVEVSEQTRVLLESHLVLIAVPTESGVQARRKLPGKGKAYSIIEGLEIEVLVRASSKGRAQNKMPSLEVLTAAIEAVYNAAGIRCEYSTRYEGGDIEEE